MEASYEGGQGQEEALAPSMEWKMDIALHVKYRYSCPILIKHEFSVQTFEGKKSSNIKFHENPSTGSRVVPYGQTARRDEATCKFFFYFIFFYLFFFYFFFFLQFFERDLKITKNKFSPCSI